MAYRMKMFKSQKPSSFDLRVSDFKRIPGFNYVLSVSTEDEHTYTRTRWLREKEKTFGDRCRTSRAAAREAKIPAASSSVGVASRLSPLGP